MRQSVQCWRDSDLEGFEAQLHVNTSHAFPNHAHDHYTIGLMERGCAYCLGPSCESSLLRVRQVALINPGEVHSGVPPKGVEPTYRILNVSPEVMRVAAAEAGLGSLPEFPELVVPDPVVWSELARLCRLVAAGGDVLAKESILAGVMGRLVRCHGLRQTPMRSGQSAGCAEPVAVRRAREYLKANLSRNVRLDDLAREAGLSRYHLLRVFKGATGLSPHAFHVMRRLEYARTRIRQGRPIADAAADAGFADQSHFTNAFHRYFGYTPGRYAAGADAPPPAQGTKETR